MSPIYTVLTYESYDPPAYEPYEHYEAREPPAYEDSYFIEGQRIRHTLQTHICTSIWVGIYSKNGVLYKGKILSLHEFAKSHRRNIIGWKECEVDGWKECEYEVDGKWISTDTI